MSEAKSVSITINLSEGGIVISGSEEFVERNLDSVFAFVERNRSVSPMKQIKNVDSDAIVETVSKEIKEDVASDKLEEGIEKYFNNGICHKDEETGNISILKKIPGANKTEKTKNIALIVAYVKKTVVDKKEIIPICQKHNCYDSSNFSAMFRKEKTNFIYKSLKGTWTLELTVPGEDSAKALLEGMCDGKE